MTRLRLIINGKSARDPRVRAAVAAVRGDGHEVEPRVTWEAADATRMTREALAANPPDVIVAAGGDGTVNEVFGAAYLANIPKSVSLAILPLGTANDFAHAAGIPIDDLTAALRLAATAPPRPLDLPLLDGRPFVNMVTGGFGSRVTVETDPELKRHLGGLAYVLTGVAKLQDLTASTGHFRAAGFDWEGRFLAMAIGNGRQAGGGIQLCPDARADDGLLDLMILPELSQEERIDAFSSLLHLGAQGIGAIQRTARSPWIEYTSNEELHVNLDGEPIRTRSFRVECRPGALQVRLGPTAMLG